MRDSDKILQTSSKITLAFLAFVLMLTGWIGDVFPYGTQSGTLLDLRRGSRVTDYMFHQPLVDTYTFYFGTQSVTGSGTAGYITGTSTALPRLQYNASALTFNFVGATLQNEGVDVTVSSDLTGYIAVSGGTGTGNVLTNPTLAGAGTISANVSLSGNITANALLITPTELSYINNASSEIQAQITTATGSITNHVHSGSDGTTQIAHDSVTGIGTNSHTTIDSFISSKAQASGLASLDANSLVVENPANATATPTASKILIADGSGKIADGWLNSTVSLLGQTIELGTETTGNTDNIGEGSSNLYYLDSRVNAAVGSLSVSAHSDIVFTSPAEGHKLVFDASLNVVNATDTAIVAWNGITGGIPTDNESVSVFGGVGVGEGKIPVGSSTGQLDNSWIPDIVNTLQTFTSSNGSSAVYIIQDYVSAGTVTANYTGDSYQYSIPAGVTQLYLKCYGARGGNSPSANGANGGYAAGYLNVSPQDVLYIYAGGIGGIPTGTSTAIDGGGWNGGGHSTLNSGNGFYGAGGGGMSDVRLNGTSTSNIVLLAAGGGGAGHYSLASGGAGGGLTGNAGNGNNEASKGKGATQSIGGSGGTDVNAGGTGTAYSGGRGSVAGSARGGGGGGGYYGGGGGAANDIGGAGGGGGGSSWFHASITGTSTATGSNSGNGYIVVSPISTSANYPDADPLLAIKDINSAILIQLLPNGKMAVGNKFIVGTTTETFFGTDIVLELNGDGYADDWLVPSFKEAKEAIIPLNAVKKQKYLDDLRNTDFVQYRYKDDIETRGGIITNDPNIAVADWMKDKKNPNLKSTSKYIDGLGIAMQALALNCEAEVGNNITKLQSLQNDIKLVMQALRDFAATGTFTAQAIDDRLEVLEPAP